MSIVERLRGLDTFGYQSQLACEAADLIEQQAERIKELEADNRRIMEATITEGVSATTRELRDRIEELKAEVVAMTKDRDTWKGECLDGTVTKQLAALRQRIADAPVVAWVIRNAECDLKGWIPAKVWADGELQYPLISKEDLQK